MATGYALALVTRSSFEVSEFTQICSKDADDLVTRVVVAVGSEVSLESATVAAHEVAHFGGIGKECVH
jgi:hypothetical protein